MLEHFMHYFRVERTVYSTGDFYNDVISQLGGRTYAKGLLRSFRYEDLPDWMERVKDAFPGIKQEYRLLAFDWLGNIFGVGQNDKGKEVVLVFDLMDDFYFRSNLDPCEWLDRYIPWNPEDHLHLDLYREWYNRTKQPLRFQDAVSLKTPLDYGGELNMDNLELCDMDVYWAVFTAFRNWKEGLENRRKRQAEEEAEAEAEEKAEEEAKAKAKAEAKAEAEAKEKTEN